MSEIIPMTLKCPYCRKWFTVKSDLGKAVSNINRHIGQSHPDRQRVRVEFVSQSLLAYITVRD